MSEDLPYIEDDGWEEEEWLFAQMYGVIPTWIPGQPVPVGTGQPIKPSEVTSMTAGDSTATTKAPPPPHKTAYVVLHVKFDWKVPADSSVAAGYDMAWAIEDVLREPIQDLLRPLCADADELKTTEVYVQCDVR